MRQKVMALLLGISLLLSVGAVIDTYAAKPQPVITFAMNACTVAFTCNAEFLVGDTVIFTGTLTDQDNNPISNANIEIVNISPLPKLVVIANGTTGIDGSYNITWNAKFSPTEKVDVTLKKFIDESMVLFARFNGNENFAEIRSGKLTATIKANDLITSVNSEKRIYPAGESATVFITFIDSNNEFTDPDSVRIIFDDQEIKPEKKANGRYVVTTPELTVGNHQIIVLPKKADYNLQNGYLTVQVSGFFGRA